MVPLKKTGLPPIVVATLIAVIEAAEIRVGIDEIAAAPDVEMVTRMLLPVVIDVAAAMREPVVDPVGPVVRPTPRVKFESVA